MLVTTTPCLALVDSTVELTVYTNASLVAAGGVVLANFSGRKIPVACYSKKKIDINSSIVQLTKIY